MVGVPAYICGNWRSSVVSCRCWSWTISWRGTVAVGHCETIKVRNERGKKKKIRWNEAGTWPVLISTDLTRKKIYKRM